METLTPTVSSTSGPESRVLIIMTGGTICMRRSLDGLVPARGFLNSGLRTRPSFNDGSEPGPIDVVTDDSFRKPDLLSNGQEKSQNSCAKLESLRTPVSTYKRCIRYCVYEFEQLLDSSSIDSEGWSRIALTVLNNYHLFDGFVILHGTDSMGYTSSALSFMLQDLGKPVVLTGSQVPILELQNDATDNLLGSLIIAGHFMIPEVTLFFNYNLYRGNRATKVSASDFAAFASPNYPPLATVSAAGTKVYWHMVHRPTRVQRLSLQNELDTASVACLRIFPGIKPEMVNAVLNVPGLKGLILETFGAGNAPSGHDGGMTRILGDAVRRGIVVVNVTQCLSGSVSPIYASATALGKEAGVVFGHDMTSEGALTKLAYLLALPNSSPGFVAEQMSKSLRGELTETARPHFKHPGIEDDLSPKLAALAALGYKIMEGDLDGVRLILDSQEPGVFLLNTPDYLGNTPLHLAAASPNVAILREFLTMGASVHVRNLGGNTPLFIATGKPGYEEHVKCLQDAGGHFHADEVDMHKRLSRLRTKSLEGGGYERSVRQDVSNRGVL